MSCAPPPPVNLDARKRLPSGSQLGELYWALSPSPTRTGVPPSADTRYTWLVRSAKRITSPGPQELSPSSTPDSSRAIVVAPPPSLRTLRSTRPALNPIHSPFG